jgi:succinate--hydroxymethylglutarate CoA-transferase
MYFKKQFISTNKKKYYCQSSIGGLLKGVRVVDMSRVLAGPYCTMILGDMGAEIIKIENPNIGDETRTWGPPYLTSSDGNHSLSAYFISINRNKHSLTVNVKEKKGKEIIYNLIKESDIFIENYIPGKLNSMGFSYEKLSSINPRIIYVSLTGYGSDGPHGQRPGYDVVIEAEAGLMSITGEKDGNPMKVGVAVTDLQTGLYAHGAILAALYAREKSGKGQKIDVSLLETQVASLVNVGSSYLISGKEPKRRGTEHPSIVPYQLFKTKSKNEEEENGIVIGCGNNRQFEILCNYLGRPELVNHEEMKTNELRVKNREKVIEIIQKEIEKESSEFWMSKFIDSGLPCGPLNNLKQTFSHPQVLHRNMVTEIEHEKLGIYFIIFFVIFLYFILYFYSYLLSNYLQVTIKFLKSFYFLCFT